MNQSEECGWKILRQSSRDFLPAVRDSIVAMDAEHAALLEFYRAMKALRPWTPFGSEKRLNEAYELCKELGL